MYLKSATVKYYLPHSFSLKDKRQIRRRIIERTKQKFNVSIAEVDTQDVIQTLTIGFSLVSGGSDNATEIYEKVLRYLGETPDAELMEIVEFE